MMYDNCRTVLKILINPFCIQDKLHKLRGPGVDDQGKVKIEFSIVSDREECQLPDAFTGSKNIVPGRSYRILKS